MNVSTRPACGAANRLRDFFPGRASPGAAAALKGGDLVAEAGGFLVLFFFDGLLELALQAGHRVDGELAAELAGEAAGDPGLRVPGGRFPLGAVFEEVGGAPA